VESGSGTLLRAPNLGWFDLPVVDELIARLDVELPISVENEANLAALEEHCRGAARGLRSFVSVFGSVGVGGGIVVDGQLFRGAHGFGGELGHITVERDGAPCGCGSRGCLEAYVGQDAIARLAGVPVANGHRRSLTDELVRRAAAGDERVVAGLGEAGTVLGSALASTLNLFDLDAVVLGGCFGPLAPWLLAHVKRELAGHVMSAAWSSCEVQASSLGEDAAVRGAAALTLRRVLDAPWTVSPRHVAREVALA
jgi:predicted NBD/HSP70 family sugar kinase